MLILFINRILSGVITGAAISHEIASLHRNFERSSNAGHFFMAVDISSIMSVENYYDRMDTLIEFIKASKTKSEVTEILIPGETRWRNYAKQLTEGICLEGRVIESLNTLAEELNIVVPWS